MGLDRWSFIIISGSDAPIKLFGRLLVRMGKIFGVEGPNTVNSINSFDLLPIVSMCLLRSSLRAICLIFLTIQLPYREL